MQGLPAPLPSAGPGVPALRAAARNLRAAAVQAARLSPQDWLAPSAEQYRRQIHRLAADIRRAADQVDVAVAVAQQHAAELEYVRQALVGGHPVPR